MAPKRAQARGARALAAGIKWGSISVEPTGFVLLDLLSLVLKYCACQGLSCEVAMFASEVLHVPEFKLYGGNVCF